MVSMKKILLFTIAITFFVLIYCSLVFANEQCIIINNIKYSKEIENIDSRLFIPLNDVESYMGVSSSCDWNTGKIGFERSDVTILMSLDNNIMNINDSQIIMDTKPQNINDKIFIPLKDLAEALGYTVKWDSTTKSVNIDTNDIIIGSGVVSIPLERIDLNKINCNKVFDENYIDKGLFDRMFSKGWKIAETRKYLSECINSDETNRMIFTRWKIQYTDSEDKERFFYFYNDESLEYNVENNIINTLNDYYTEYLYNELDNNIIDLHIHFNFTGRSVSTSQYPEKAYREYIVKLCTKEDIVDMSELNIKNAFKLLPVFCNVTINFNNSDSSNIYICADKINRITNYTANIEYVVKCGDKNIVEKLYLNGKEYINKNPNVLKLMSDLTYDIYKNTLLIL